MKITLSFAIVLLLLTGCNKNIPPSTTTQSPPDVSVDTSAVHPHVEEPLMMELPQLNALLLRDLGTPDSQYDNRFVMITRQYLDGGIALTSDAIKKAHDPNVRKVAERLHELQLETRKELEKLGYILPPMPPGVPIPPQPPGPMSDAPSMGAPMQGGSPPPPHGYPPPPR